MRRAFVSLACVAMLIACEASPLAPTSTSSPIPNPTSSVGSPATPDASVPAPTLVAPTSDTGIDSSSPCAPESQHELCSRYDTLCGSLAAIDNCGDPLTVSNCGDCLVGYACVAGACVTVPPTVPYCVPETDKALCAQYGKNCGSLTNFDNCGGMPRTVTSCGVCAVSDTCESNVCVAPAPPDCVPESNQAFCAANGDNCGTHTAFDNCHASRTVASCGSLRFDGMGPIDIVGGIPLELTGASTRFHVSVWISMSSLPEIGHGGGPPPTNIFEIGHGDLGPTSMFNLGITSSGFLSLNGQISTINVPLNQWILVFADSSYILVRENSVGIIDQNGNVQSYGFGSVPFGTNALVPGDYVHLGTSFVGQMNYVRFWSVSVTDSNTNYHDCLPIPQPGLVRQWCALEGSGPTTSDGVTGVPSLLNTATWDTGACF